MVQVLCFTGKGYDTCWRPASVANRVAIHGDGHGLELPGGNAPYSLIRFA